jgi:ankyrin repeat protein
MYRRNHDAVQMLRSRLMSLDLWEASALGELQTVRSLVQDAGSAINALSPDGLTALQLASFFGRAGVVEILLAHGADPNVVSTNAQRICALHGATVGRHAEIVEQLIAAGANVDARSANGQTALEIAMKNGDETVVKLLTKH